MNTHTVVASTALVLAAIKINDMAGTTIFYVTGTAGGDAEVAAEGVTVAELLTHCRERLLSYEVPYTVRIMRSLPTGGLDKVRADA